MENKTESKRINVNLNAGILDELDRQASTNGLSRSGYITHMVLKVRDAERTMEQIQGMLSKVQPGEISGMIEELNKDIERLGVKMEQGLDDE